MQVRLLGPLEVVGPIGPVPLDRAKERAVLSVLALHPNQVVTEDRLVDALWGDDPPRTATKTLQSYVSRLRRVLATAGDEARIETTSGGYRLSVSRDTLDVARVEDLVSEARAATARDDPASAAVALTEASRAWRGDPLGEFADDEWARVEAARLAELHTVVLEERIDAELACGRHAALVAELEALCSAHPLRERLWAQRMIALYRSGRQAEALRVYQELRTTLADELGIDPSPELQAIERAVLAQDPALAGGTHVPPFVAAAGSELPSGVVTFLLTDIEGSTRLWDTRPDDMVHALVRHDAIVGDLVTSSGGTVIKSKGEGDSTMSVFRRATDAAAAAIAMQLALAAERWPGGLELRVRAAMHTGEAEVRDGDYFGTTVNRAARVRGLAAGGQVLCSRATADLIVDRLPAGASLVEMGRQELRDLARAEHVYAFTHPRFIVDALEPAPTEPARTPLPAALVDSPVFVGRASELDRLGRMWAAARAGEPRTAFLVGEPGIGKTALAGEFARAAFDDGATVLYGRCEEDLGAAYRPFVEALRHFVANCPIPLLHDHVEEFGSDLSRMVPDLARRVSGLPPVVQAEPEDERLRLFDTAAGLLARAATDAPIVLVVEDLHWATKPTLLLLRHLVSEASRIPLMIVGTYRDTDIGRTHPFAETLGDVRRAPGVERFALAGLDEGDIGSLLAAVSRSNDEERTAELASVLHDQTNGNPFFVNEIVRHWTETGLDSTTEDPVLPEGIRDVVGRRLSRLSDAANRMLAIAAVVGDEFDYSILEHVAKETSDHNDELDMLDEAVRAGILVEVPGRHVRYRFAHSLIRQTLHEELTTARRLRLHRHVAEAIEALYRRDIDTHLPELAHHYAEAASEGDIDRAADYALRAARQALERAAYEDAITYAEAGLSVLDLDVPPAHEVRFELLLAIADAHTALLDYEKAVAAAYRAADAGRALGSPVHLARAARAAGVAHPYGLRLAADPAVVALCEEALDGLSADDVGPSAQVLAALALHRTLLTRPSSDTAAMAWMAVEAARAADDAESLCLALRAAAWSYAVTGTVAPALDAANELVDLAHAHGFVQHEMHGYAHRLAHQAISGDIVGFRRDVEQLDELARRARSRLFVPAVLQARAFVALFEGRFSDADALVDQIFATPELDLAMVQSTFGTLLHLRRDQGRMAELLPEVSVAAEDVAIAEGVMVADLSIRAELGLVDEVRELFDQCVTEAARFMPPTARGVTMGMMAEIAAVIDDARHLDFLRAELTPGSGGLASGGQAVCWGAVDRFLGILDTLAERYDDAEREFTAAAALETRIESPPLLARTRYWHAWMLARRDEDGDADRALALVRQCRATAQSLGMVSLDAQAKDLERRLSRAGLPAIFRADEERVFVGRHNEVSLLTGLWNEARSGKLRAALVSGEPGIGKTALAGEIARLAYEARGLVLYGRCEEDLGVGYQPFIEALSQYVAACPTSELLTHDPRDLALLARLLPEIGDRVADLPPVPHVEPDTERFWLFEAVAGFLDGTAQEAPIVLVLDDLHWAAQPSLLLVRHLVHGDAPILIIATYRDTELGRDHPLAATLADLRRESNVARVRLMGLREDDVAVLVERTRTDVDATSVYEATDGNPFFVREVLRHLSESGTNFGIPEGVKEVVGRRLSALSDDTNRVLAFASIIGREFGLDLLERVCDVAGDQLVGAIEEALQSGLVDEVPDTFGRYAFGHALVRETVYRELATPRRVRLHMATGEALEQLAGDDLQSYVADLARHFYEAAQAGGVTKAVDYCRRAGDRAIEVVAFEDAVAHYERALLSLDLDPQAPAELRGELLLQLSGACRGAGDVSRGLAALDDAVDLARARDDTELLGRSVLARSWLVVGHAGWTPPGIALTEPLVTLLREALDALPEDDSALRAGLLSRLAVTTYFTESHDVRQETADAAVAMARRTGDTSAVIGALADRVTAMMGPDNVAERLASVEEIISLAEASGETERVLESRCRIIDRLLDLGDAERLDLHLLAAVAEAEQLRQPQLRWSVGLLETVRLMSTGHFEEAERRALRSYEQAVLIGFHGAQSAAGGQMLMISYERGEFDRLEAALEPIESLISDEQALVPATWIAAELGKLDEARAKFEVFAEVDFANVPRDLIFLVCMSLLAHTCAILDDKPRAAIMYDLLAPYAGRNAESEYSFWHGPIDRYLAMLAVTTGDTDRAIGHLEAALAMCTKMNARPTLARTQMELGSVLLERDPERARELLSSALATADDLGMKAVAERCRAVLV